MAWQPPSESGPPHIRGFTITFKYNTLDRTPLYEWSAWRRDLYLTKHNTHNRQTSMSPASFEPAVPAIEQPQTHALGRAAMGTGRQIIRWTKLSIFSITKVNRIIRNPTETFINNGSVDFSTHRTVFYARASSNLSIHCHENLISLVIILFGKCCAYR
jgi:hypothetical protein